MPLVTEWPYAILFALVMLWTYWPEARIIWRSRSMAGSQDRGSLRFIIVGGNLGPFVALALAVAVPAAAIPARRTAYWAAIATIVAASLLRRHCFRMLGKSFTGAVVVQPGQAVVRRGAYRLVRHPSYTAATLLNAGVGLVIGNWASLLAIVCVSVVVYGYRVAVEERALLATLGDPYREYMRRTKRFIPFVI